MPSFLFLPALCHKRGPRLFLAGMRSAYTPYTEYLLPSLCVTIADIRQENAFPDQRSGGNTNDSTVSLPPFIPRIAPTLMATEMHHLVSIGQRAEDIWQKVKVTVDVHGGLRGEFQNWNLEFALARVSVSFMFHMVSGKGGFENRVEGITVSSAREGVATLGYYSLHWCRFMSQAHAQRQRIDPRKIRWSNLYSAIIAVPTTVWLSTARIPSTALGIFRTTAVRFLRRVSDRRRDDCPRFILL